MVVRLITSSRTYILSEIVETCKRLKKSGEDLLRNYFHLGSLVDTLHSMGLSYRMIEKELRDREFNEWIPKHTTLFNAHKFYLTVKKKFDADIERFMAENPELTWRELSHRLLPESRRKSLNRTRCSTVEHDKPYIKEPSMTSLPSPTKTTHNYARQTASEDEDVDELLPKKPAMIYGRALHEILSDRKVLKTIPPKKLLNLLPNEYVPSKKDGSCLAISLNPPYNYLKVLRCPNCLNIIRAAAAGAPVACLECGFPNRVIG
ncbi:MAG: hypothetical protein QXN89_03830 [Candidatus Woesearchaeota archaeon]